MNTKRLVSFAISFSIASILSTIVYIYYVFEKESLQDDIRLVSKRIERLTEAEIISLRRIATVEKEFYQFLLISPDLEVPYHISTSHLREMSFFENNLDNENALLNQTLISAYTNQIKKIPEKDELLKVYNALKDNRWIKGLLSTAKSVKEGTKIQKSSYEITDTVDAIGQLRTVNNQFRETLNAYRKHFSETNKWNIEQLNQLEKVILYLIILIFVTQIGVYFLSNKYEFLNLKLENYDTNFTKRKVILMAAVFFSGSAFLVDQITLQAENKRSNYTADLDMNLSADESLTDIHRETRAISILLNETTGLKELFANKSPLYEGNEENIETRKYYANMYQAIASLNSFSNWIDFLRGHKDDIYTIRENTLEIDQKKLLDTFTKQILSAEILNGSDEYQSVDLIIDLADSFKPNLSDAENPGQVAISAYKKNQNMMYFLMRFYENTISQHLQNKSQENIVFLRKEINWYSVLIGILIAIGTALQVIALLSMFEFLRLSYICRSKEDTTYKEKFHKRRQET